MRRYVQPIGEQWVAMIVTDDAPPPEPGSVKGIAFFGGSAAVAEQPAVAHLGEGIAQE